MGVRALCTSIAWHRQCEPFHHDTVQARIEIEREKERERRREQEEVNVSGRLFSAVLLLHAPKPKPIKT